MQTQTNGLKCLRFHSSWDHAMEDHHRACWHQEMTGSSWVVDTASVQNYHQEVELSTPFQHYRRYTPWTPATDQLRLSSASIPASILCTAARDHHTQYTIAGEVWKTYQQVKTNERRSSSIIHHR